MFIIRDLWPGSYTEFVFSKGHLQSLKHRMAQIGLPRKHKDFVIVCHGVGHSV